MLNTLSRRNFLKSTGIAALGCLPGLSLTACYRKAQPNILWISCEDIGPALGCYGDDYADTPNLDQLAREGIVYEHAFATAPICAPSRSCLITGMYAQSLGTQHLRSEIPRADSITTIPEYLRRGGYYCSNNSKTDYNFTADGMWDDNGNSAHWRQKMDGQPFFSVFNFGITHEGHANSLDDKDVQHLSKHHDPEKAVVPPYYPNTPKMRKIWAHQYDLITVMDQQVGEIIQQLKDDGLYDETIIFFFADHGFGLPRYKRWLYKTGLQVPLIVRVPDKFKYLLTDSSSRSQQLVSFVDFAPTVLQCAGQKVPDHMQGYSFLGQEHKNRQYVFGARDRADDVYDLSRCVLNERYIYIRNYMPHLPYIQRALIFSDQKSSFAELNRLKENKELSRESLKMYQPKPREELYDLENDPHELDNLVDDPDSQHILEEMRAELRQWILQIRDTAFLHEAELMIRSENTTPYDYAQQDDYRLQQILDTAEWVGRPEIMTEQLIERLYHEDSGVRFWAATALLAKNEDSIQCKQALQKALQDESPSVQIVAAEALCAMNDCERAVQVLKEHLFNDKEWVVLQAARSVQCIGDQAQGILPAIRQARENVSGEIWGRYKSWSYPMFIGMALDQALLNCGVDVTITK